MQTSIITLSGILARARLAIGDGLARLSFGYPVPVSGRRAFASRCAGPLVFFAAGDFLPGFERPSRQKAMLTDDELLELRRLRAERRAIARRREFVKQIIEGVLSRNRPRGQRRLHRLIASKYQSVNYYQVGELLAELERDGRARRLSISQGWIKL